ncbi:Broad-range acid phosphatase DET1 [Purpureocillium lavendulum]|uniref:Broad-range acid phosphatase DET1 n=1 Tax=Purpureocillium lavendulum TaxID=1247861 RepID=A0AB34FSW7_9HYPO|nr:Broad-range acid phosphatase DET1 [Purpureocillium lavendulum]
MSPQEANTNGAGGGNGDDYRLPNTAYQTPSRKSSQQTLVASDGEQTTTNAQQGGPVQHPMNGASVNGASINGASVSNVSNTNNANNVANNANSAGNGGRRSVSSPHPVLTRIQDGFYAWNNNSTPDIGLGPYTNGFNRAMAQRQEEQRARGCVPAPIGTSCRPTANGNGTCASELANGTTVQSGAASAPLLGSNMTATTPVDNNVREGIENAVEQQVSEALGPLRFIAANLGNLVRNVGQENSDFHEQNNTLSRQLDLHYEQINQQSEHANAHVRTLLNLIENQSSNGQGTADSINSLVTQMTQMIASVPGYLGSVLQHSTQTGLLPALYRAVQETVQTNVQHAVQDAVQNNVQYPVQDIIQATMQTATQDAIVNLQDTVHLAVQNELQTTVQHTIQANVQQAVQTAIHSLQEALTDEMRNAIELVVSTQRQAFDNVLRFHIQRSVEFEREQAQRGVGSNFGAQAFGGDEYSLAQGNDCLESADVDAGADTENGTEDAQLLENEKPAGKGCGKVKAFFAKLFKFGRK